MFRRSASELGFAPRDGDVVEVDGRLSVYEPRGDLQLVVDRMVRCGAGSLFEEFLRRKAALDAEGLFDPARKRPVPRQPRCIGVVTSLAAAALRDVATTLHRRAPHIPVVLAPALVQGAGAPAELCAALQALYAWGATPPRPGAAGEDSIPGASSFAIPVEVILLVRGGGSIEDLWAFNDEALARTIAASPVPVVSGVGHETDFTIADFVADARAATPTAAAELAASEHSAEHDILNRLSLRLATAMQRRFERHAQRLDALVHALRSPAQRCEIERLRLATRAQALRVGVAHALHSHGNRLERKADQLAMASRLAQGAHRQRLEHAALRLDLLAPQHVLERGYAWLGDAQGTPITRCAQTHPGQRLTATLCDGTVPIAVLAGP
ncbi:exodeoxyribonuclease VII large subunit [Candidatus Symbiobacter mobilis CR]|uniref:Exodeoxyribonuclease 7 large subunit n=2 Tax=Candidatus Symbiobacter TaxID=1436289 RepID=U5NBN8_9BURK|nr:exodeoxyribonuclease VII large subunit [Candidatus Symbiobacter mobilis CR]